MKGKHTFVVSNRFIKYEFTINRNITIIQGDSATGKTTLLNMLYAYSVEKENSGINVQCDVPFFVYQSLAGMEWSNILKLNEGSIVFIEEDYDFVSTTEFAEYLQNSDSYFVIVTREDLENLPYSVEEIYCIKESGKYAKTVQVYNLFEKIYENKVSELETIKKPENVTCVITEDSKSGFQFWKNICEQNAIECVSSFGKSNVLKCIKEMANENVMLVVDGAAFGSQMRRTVKGIEQYLNGECIFFLPECFEWMLLKADLVPNIAGIQDMLECTYDYADSKEFMSWERFYSQLMVNETVGKQYQYNKNSLNDYYIGELTLKKVRKKFNIVDILCKE